MLRLKRILRLTRIKERLRGVWKALTYALTWDEIQNQRECFRASAALLTEAYAELMEKMDATDIDYCNEIERLENELAAARVELAERFAK